jgi:hypothetical protein
MKLLFASFLALYLGATPTQKHEVVGVWKFISEDGTGLVIHFGEDNIFRVDFEGDGSYDLKGAYIAKGNNISITDSEGDCEGKTGIYTMTFEGNEMALTQLSEECEARVAGEGEKLEFSRQE